MEVRGSTKSQKQLVTVKNKFIENAIENKTISNLDATYYDQYNLIFCYKYYIIHTHGLLAWVDLLEDKRFRRMFYYSVKVYGNSILPELVDITVDYLNVPSSQIFIEFSQYCRILDTLDIQEFARYN